MVNQEDLEAMRAEYAATQAEVKALRSTFSVVGAQLTGDEDMLEANETPQSPTAHVEILTREQKVLMASLRLAEELVALMNSNDALFRRGQQLIADNASLKEKRNTILSAQTQGSIRSAPLDKSNALATPLEKANARAAPVYHSPAAAPSDNVSSPYPTPTKKCSPEEKAERRELVAAMLKAGLDQDGQTIQTIAALRPAAVQPPIVPKIRLNQEAYESPRSRVRAPSASELAAGIIERSRGRDPQMSELASSGARMRESSHSAAVTESKYLRQLAIKDVLLGISQNTPRRTPRSGAPS